MYHCTQCLQKISSKQSSIGCIRCNGWTHIKCTRFSNISEAKKKQDTYKCDNCIELAETPDKVNDNPEDNSNLAGEGIGALTGEKVDLNFFRKFTRTDLDSLGEGGWVTDTIIGRK